MTDEDDGDADDKNGEDVEIDEDDTANEITYVDRMKNTLGEDSSGDEDEEGGDSDATGNDGDDDGNKCIPV